MSESRMPDGFFFTGIEPCLGKDTCVYLWNARARTHARLRDITTEFVMYNKWCCYLPVSWDVDAGG